jgi:DNA-binding transcriptional ArsR family regulator
MPERMPERPPEQPVAAHSEPAPTAEPALSTEPVAPDHPEPPEEVREIGSPAEFAALGHPLRHRLLSVLGKQPATVSQLAVRLAARKGNVAHHLKVLREAGLVHVTATRQVRGGTEQYYQRTARRIIVAEPRPADTTALLGAVAEELNRSPAETHLVWRQLRLTPANAERLRAALTELADEAVDDPVAVDDPAAEEDRSGEVSSYGVLLAFYEQARPGP